MSDALKKALGLAGTATEAEMIKALEDREKLAKFNELVAKMSDKHKAFMDGDNKMPKGGKDAFASMSASERDDHMKSCGAGDDDVEKMLKAGDAFKTPEGILVTRKAAGAMFDVFKSQNAALVKQADELAKSKDREDEAAFAKRATDSGLDAAFGTTIRKAFTGDATAQGEIFKRFAALNKQVETGEVFSNFGKSSAKEGSAEGELLAKVAEIKKGDSKLSDQQAYAKAYKDPANREIVKRMRAEQQKAA